MNTTTSLPSQKSRENLNNLSESFAPKDVKFLLALNSTVSIEELTSNSESLITGIKKFSESGYNMDVAKQLGLNITHRFEYKA